MEESFENITGELSSEFNGPSMLEMELGTYLSAICYLVAHPEEVEDLLGSIAMVLDHADPAIEEWYSKYEAEIEADVE